MRSTRPLSHIRTSDPRLASNSCPYGGRARAWRGHDKLGAPRCLAGDLGLGTVGRAFERENSRMALQVRVQLVVVAEDGEAVVQDLADLAQEHERIEQLGLTLSEAKAILRELQRQVLERQIADFVSSRAACSSCGRARGIKDHKSLTFRTLFGKL